MVFLSFGYWFYDVELFIKHSFAKIPRNCVKRKMNYLSKVREKKAIQEGILMMTVVEWVYNATYRTFSLNLKIIKLSK